MKEMGCIRVQMKYGEILILTQSIPAWEELLTPLSKRPVDELPWLQLAVGDMGGLSSTLLNIFTLKRMQQ